MPRDDQVVDAFDLLTDEIDMVITDVSNVMAERATAQEFDDVDALSTAAKELKRLKGSVAEVEASWRSLNLGSLPGFGDEADHGSVDADGDVTATDGGEGHDGDASLSGPKRYFGRVKRGTKTPQPAYYRPILASLERRGGRAALAEVLGDVEEELSAAFTPVDFEPLPSDDNQVRWRNTAQWARNTLVNEGLLERPRRRGVWEISDEGRRWLREGGVGGVGGG